MKISAEYGKCINEAELRRELWFCRLVMREFFPIFCNSGWKGSGGEEDVVFFDEGEGLVGEFGLAEAFVAGVVLTVDDANLGV